MLSQMSALYIYIYAYLGMYRLSESYRTFKCCILQPSHANSRTLDISIALFEPANKMWWLYLVTIVLATMCLAQNLDLEDMNQYMIVKVHSFGLR
jgi:hypothetical protein